jgi:hypothetical protein
MDQALCSKIERPIQFNFEVFQGSNQSGAKKCRRFLMIFGVGNYRVFHKFIPPQTVKQSQVRRHYTRDVYVHKAPVDAGPKLRAFPIWRFIQMARHRIPGC